jgi:hypothetical protein
MLICLDWQHFKYLPAQFFTDMFYTDSFATQANAEAETGKKSFIKKLYI